MPRQWRAFQGRVSLSETKQPQISLQRGGTFGVNRALYDALGKPKRVMLFWDGQSAMGIRPASDGAKGSYPIGTQPQGSSFTISAKAFLQWARIPFGDRVYYYTPAIEEDEEGPIAVVEFDHEVTPDADGDE